MTMNFAHILLPCTLFVPSFEGHKKHAIEIVVKLLVLNRNKKIIIWFRGWYSNHKGTTKPMCILMISNDPFKTKNGPCPKSPRVGGMHSGVTLDMWNRYQKCITTHKEVRFKPFFISCSQSKRVKSIQWCFCTVSVSASMSKHVRIRNMFPFLSTFQIFLNSLMGCIPWCFVYKLLYWDVSWETLEPF